MVITDNAAGVDLTRQAPSPPMAPVAPAPQFRPQGVLRVVTNSEIDAREEEERQAGQEADVSPTAGASLVADLQLRFEEARRARDDLGVTQDLRDAYLARQSKYSETYIAKLRLRQLPEIYAPITETKCNATEAWMQDIENSVGEKTWMLTPTPAPDLSEQVKSEAATETTRALLASLESGNEYPETDKIEELREQIANDIAARLKREARDRAGAMRTQIEDQLTEANWKETKRCFRAHTIAAGTGFIKGPFVTKRKVLKWIDGKAAPETAAALNISAPHPMDMYPEGNVMDPNDGGMFERMLLTRGDLNKMAEHSGYKGDEIRSLLESYTEGVPSTDPSVMVRKQDEQRPQHVKNGNEFEVFEFWGPISGTNLLSAGVEGVEATKDYHYQVIFCNGRLLKLMRNPDPLDRSIYSVARFKAVPGRLWGRGVPHLIDTPQKMGNSASRSIFTNMGLSSAPMLEVDLSQIPEGQKITEMRPMQILFSQTKPHHTRHAYNFFQPQDNTEKLMALYDRAESMADDASGVPAYAYGSDEAAGAAKTVGGLSLLLNAAGRGMKDALSNMDTATAAAIERIYAWNMVYSDKEAIKGDCRVEVKGTMGILVIELRQARIAEFLDRLNNPTIQELVGPEYTVEVLREYAKLMQIDTEALLPSREEVLKRLEENQKMAQQVQQAETEHKRKMEESKVQIQMEELAIKREELDLKRAETAAKLEKGATLSIAA